MIATAHRNATCKRDLLLSDVSSLQISMLIAVVFESRQTEAMPTLCAVGARSCVR